MAYFERTGEREYTPSQQTAGAWNIKEQHIAPSIGLLAHVVETDRQARGRDDLRVGRLSYDILGPIPIEPMTTEVAVLRPGRSVELVEAVLSHNGRSALRLRAWLLRTSETSAIAGTPIGPLPARADLAPFDPSTLWAGDFIASIEVRRRELELGAAVYWLRATDVLLTEEPVSDLARAALLFDVANGMAVRARPEAVAFPNVDLTAHLHRIPTGDWVGFETRVTFGRGGVGLTSSVIHDLQGPVGTVAQILTLSS
ncbi:thioesterase family protein [Nocardioides sp. Bht2]|uniref:thioesterase family protein n=1 Tax=Nocardioides sp. Bht2 TaxID=3392297 RepID=UPI0039B4D8C7